MYIMRRISETYRDSIFPNDDPRLKLPGYNVVRADNSNHAKRDGVFVSTLRSHSLFVR